MAVSYKGKRVLIIDDLPEARSYTSDMLRSFGAEQVVTSASGEEALEMLRSESFDLVLCDYNLGPGKDGQQVLEELRHGQLLPNRSAFVIITAESNPDMVMGALEHQPDGYITKPYTKSDLKQRLDKLLRQKVELQPIESAIDSGQYQQALEQCDAVAHRHPGQRLRAARHKGQLLLMLRRFDEARDLYRSLLDIRPIAWARLGLGKAYYYLGEKAEAEAQFRALADESAAYVQSLDWLARVQAEGGRADEALSSLQRAVERSPKAVLRQLELGRAAEVQQDGDICEKAFRKAVHLGRHSVHKSPDAYFGLSSALERRLDSNDAGERRKAGDEMLRMLREVDKSFDDRAVKCRAAATRAQACRKLGKEQEAREAQARAESLLSKLEQPDAALAAMVRGDGDSAAEKARAVAAANEHSESLNNEGVDLYKRGKLMDAFVRFEEAAGNPNASVAVLLNALQAGIALAQQGNAPDGWREEIGEWNERLGEIAPAEPHYQRLARLRELLAGL